MTTPAALRATSLAAVAAAGLTAVGELFHRFATVSAGDASAGITGVVLLAESHVAVHTWPELGAATLDVYVCNLGADNSRRAELGPGVDRDVRLGEKDDARDAGRRRTVGRREAMKQLAHRCQPRRGDGAQARRAQRRRRRHDGARRRAAAQIGGEMQASHRPIIEAGSALPPTFKIACSPR